MGRRHDRASTSPRRPGSGVDELLDALLLVADVEIAEDLVANPKKPAQAVVLESNLDQGRGPVVTVLVEEGTLHVGDPIVAGPAWGRVRAMFDEHGEQVTEAGPSMPVEVLGLDDVPLAGDELRVAPNDKVARTVAEARAHRRKAAAQRNPMMLARRRPPRRHLRDGAARRGRHAQPRS